jgi:hypothetical protein
MVLDEFGWAKVAPHELDGWVSVGAPRLNPGMNNIVVIDDRRPNRGRRRVLSSHYHPSGNALVSVTKFGIIVSSRHGTVPEPLKPR